MLQFNKKIVVLVLALMTGAALVSFAGSDDFGAKGAEGKTDLSLDQMLTYAIQDEYLARAEYELIMKEYGSIRPFTNIMAAEVRHIEWVTELLEKYEFAVPKDSADRYIVLPEDLKASFETGVQAEIDNIAMYESFLQEEIPADVRDLFERLKQASENHLRAFRNNLNRYN